MSAKPTTLETRLAQLLRMACLEEHAGAVTNAVSALVRTLRAAGADKVHTLADRLESAAEAEGLKAELKAGMKKAYDTGYADGVQAAENRHNGVEEFHNADGKIDWRNVALFVQRNKHRLDAGKHEFIDKMAGYTVWDDFEPSIKQHRYLHSLFYQLGGKLQ